MYRSFEEIESHIINDHVKKTLAVANAQDDVSLEAVITAKRKGIINPILVGIPEKIAEILNQAGESSEDYEIIESREEREAGDIVCHMVKERKADIPMKGLMQTKTFMRAILNKEMGFFADGSLLSQATVLDFEEEHRMMVISDCAVNISPSVEEKKKITENAIKVAKSIGINKPNIAFLSAVETVNPKISSTVDAEELAHFASEGKMGEIGLAGGPLALDNALSMEAAKHKGISNPVCGHADILIVPDLCSGNILTKSLTYFAHLKSAGTLNGANIPVVMTSRTDTPEDKYFSILMAVLTAETENQK